MKNKLFAFLLVLSTLGFVYLPSELKAADQNSNTTISVNETKAAKDVRYVRVRGKRYKVWYKIFYKNGRRYVRILKMRRA